MTPREGTGRTALITGASAGIGKALAEVFARHGFDLVLTARRVERLDALATVFAQQYGIKAHVVRADLADPIAPEQLFAATEAKTLHIDAIVNNAGYGVPGFFLTNTWDTHRDFIQVMVTAVAHLTHLYLPAMIERRYGRILNVSSLAGFVPGSAGSTLYGAAKTFMIQFSQTLHTEVSDQGVFVSALCPGFTTSEFHDVTGTREKVNRLPSYWWMDAERVAAEGYHALMKGKPVHVPGGLNKVVAGLLSMMPHKLAFRLAQRELRRVRVDRPGQRV